MSFKTILYLGLRPFKPKHHGIKGVILHTILVVAIAMLPLVVVLLVADAMIEGITNRYIETSSYHMRVYSRQPADVIDFDLYAETAQSIEDIESISSVSIERDGAGVGVHNESRRGVMIRGVEESIYTMDSGFSKYMSIEEGAFDLKGEGLVISSNLARKMGVKPGDDFRLITGKVMSNGRIIPRVSKFTVTGIVKSGYEDLDKTWVFISFENAKTILPNRSSETYLGVKTHDPYIDLSSLYKEVKESVPSGWIIREWTRLNRNTYESFKTTKMVLALIMGLIVIVAAINISSSLIMLVLEKRRDIAILKGMGLSPSEVMGSYLLTGVIIGFAGTLIGLVLGVSISLNINDIILFFENVINLILRLLNLLFNWDESKSFVLLDSEYYLDDIEVDVSYLKLILMTFFSITTTAVASYFPARKAGLIKPLQIMQKY